MPNLELLKPVTASAILFLLLTACGGGSSSTPAGQPLPALPEADTLPAYEVIGSGPIVVVLAMDMQETLYNSPTTDTIVPRLLSAGYSVVSLRSAMPRRGRGPWRAAARLLGSADRGAGNRDIFSNFCSGLFGVLDQLHASTVGAMIGVYPRRLRRDHVRGLRRALP